MSEKYKNAMNKIVVSDELKAKIIENAIAKKKSVKSKSKHSKNFYLRYGMGYAACFLLCLFVVSISKNLTNSDFSPPIINTPAYETPKPRKPNDAIADIAINNNMEIESAKPTEKGSAPVHSDTPKNSNQQSIITKTRDESPKASITSPEKNPSQAEGNQQSITQSTPGATPEIIDNASYAMPTETITGDNQAVKPNASNENTTDVPGIDDQSVQITNPCIGFEDLSEIEEKLGYSIKAPQYIPTGYEIGEACLLFDELAQITYVSADDTVTFRTQKTDSDISGDYNEYKDVQAEKINGNNITLKGKDELIFTAIWNDENSYSISSDKGLKKQEIIKIIESVNLSNK